VISWRYHVVSLVAVVLAFGLGIAAGTSVVSDPLADEIRSDYTAAVRAKDQALETVAFYETFVRALEPTLRDGVLEGEEAIVVTVEGAEGPARRAVDELTAAGVDVLATFAMTPRLTDPDEAQDVPALEEILGLAGLDPGAVVDRAPDALAARLALGILGADEDVLEGLLDQGFLTADRDVNPQTLLGIGGGGELVVVAAGGEVPPGTRSPETLLVPMTQRLVQLGSPTVAVGPTEDPFGYVTAVRDDSQIPDCAMVTVDDIDLEVGGITLAMAIDRFRTDPDPAVRPGGDYGVRGDMLVPGAQEPPEACLR
jgi:hypothetical protein